MSAAREEATASRIRLHPPESGSPRRRRHHSGVGPTDPGEPDPSGQRRASRGLPRVDTEPRTCDYLHRVRTTESGRPARRRVRGRRCTRPLGERTEGIDRPERPPRTCGGDGRRDDRCPVVPPRHRFSGRPSRTRRLDTASSTGCHRRGVIGTVPPAGSAISRRHRRHRRRRRHRHHRSPWPQRTSPTACCRPRRHRRR